MTLAKKVQQRRRRQVRIRATVRGTSAVPRLAVFKSLSNIYAQLIDDDAGKVLASASSMKLKKAKPQDVANQVGQNLAKDAKKKKIEKCVFDRGGNLYHGRVKALADGARASGLKF